MTWLLPENLLWLLALLPPLILLYFLKIKRVPHVVSSIMLWHKSLHDLHANAPFQRLRRNLLLFLQILFFLLLVAALARPIVRGSAFAGRRIILLLDCSASMKARDEDGASRFERALEIAHSIADDPDKKEMMVITFSNRASVAAPFTTSPQEIRRAMKRVRCTDAGTRLDDALRIATSAARGKRDLTVVILSDGAVGSVPEISDRSYDVDFIGLGRRCRNAAITGLSVRRALEEDRGGVHLFVEVSNFSEEAMEIPLEIRHEGALVDAGRWNVEAGGIFGRTFHYADILDGLIDVRLETDDDLDVDDRAAVLVKPPRAPRVALATEGNVFLENALRTIPGVEMPAPSDAEEKEEAVDEGFDVVVYDGVEVPSNPPARSVLAFGVLPPDVGVNVEGELVSPLFGDGDWDDTHPVNRYADYTTLFVKKSMKVSLPDDAAVLLESKDGPLAAAFEQKMGKTVCVFFNVRDSDWPFHVSFPVFLSNAIFWLHGGGDPGTEGAWFRTGDPLALPPGGGRMILPAGDAVNVAPEGKGTVAFSRTEEAGVYAFEGRRGGRRRFAVNLVSPAESNLTPAEVLEIPGAPVQARPSEEVVYREYWPWLLLLALGLLLLEWWIYHRRAV
ncbi:MAG: vWA domain-containing protein [Planctomycetota bacterium]|jgi:hypothetical protein